MHAALMVTATRKKVVCRAGSPKSRPIAYQVAT
jgi:hypothetical protein